MAIHDSASIIIVSEAHSKAHSSHLLQALLYRSCVILGMCGLQQVIECKVYVYSMLEVLVIQYHDAEFLNILWRQTIQLFVESANFEQYLSAVSQISFGTLVGFKYMSPALFIPSELLCPRCL